MGRPWWHDSYWEKKSPPRRGFRLPRRQTWIWIAVLVLAMILAASITSFQPVALDWFYGFVYYLCRILIYAIIIRAMLSWFVRNRNSVLIIIFGDISEPLLTPLRKVVPRLGMFDLSPLVAIAILYLIPFILNLLLS